ncbi:TetR family transcriptional regulator [Streptomyces olivoverticillatus]
MGGMPQPPAPRKTPGRPPRISREEIIGTALRILDEGGVDRLTMRRLATEIGSTPMALYHHVRNKDELLVLLLDDYATRTLRQPELPTQPRERIIVAAEAIHEVLAACPWIVAVLTADDLLSRTALWFVEQIVDGFVDCGLTPPTRPCTVTARSGITQPERSWSGRQRFGDARTTTGPSTERASSPASTPARFPGWRKSSGRWEALTAQDTYSDGLRALVDGLATR